MNEKQNKKSEYQQIIDEELALRERLRQAVRQRALAQNPDMSDIARRLVALRDEASVASEHDLPALLDQLHLHQSLASRTFREPLPDLRAPYFAHLRLRENGRDRDILIGHRTFIEPKFDVTVVDWKSAPIAKIYFSYRDGEHFYEKLPGRVAEGTVVFRRMLSFHKGELIEVRTKDALYRRDESLQWHQQRLDELRWQAGGQGSAMRGFVGGAAALGSKDADISGLLDREQFRLLTRPDNEPLLILGGAGCGKTTVALHRLAYLAHSHSRYKQQRMLVVVPEIGLVRLSKRLLASLGMDRVRVLSYDEWILLQGRHLLRSLPSKPCRSTPAKVVRLKRHPALLELFAELEHWRWDDFLSQLQERFAWLDNLSDEAIAAGQGNLVQRLARLERELGQRSVSAQRSSMASWHSQLRDAFSSFEKQLQNLNIDRVRLLTDKRLHERLKQISDGAIDDSMLENLRQHTQKQILVDEPANYQHVDVARRTMVDGQILDSDDTDELAGTIDVEDYSLMFALLEHYTGTLSTRYGEFLRYSHILIDEAQELAPIELRMLGAALDQDASVTIAGDAAQQTDPATSFSTWQNVLHQLGVADVRGNHLTTNYRSPRQVTEFAHAILGPHAPSSCPSSLRDGPPVLFQVFPDPGHAATTLVEALEDLHRQEPRAAIAVICSDTESAQFYHQMLKDLPSLRLILDGEFSFTAGIDVTEVSLVKGLEFDYVLLPDVDVKNYPDRPEKRRLLHVAATRAMYQLWVTSMGSPSVILRDYQD